MSVFVAIPEPTSSDPAYNQRSLEPYLVALRSAGATPVLVALRTEQDQVAKLLAGVQGILLPGSRYDVDPQRYGEEPLLECTEADPARAAVDELLLQDAFNLRKPILAICHGAQALNVWRNGSLIQDLQTAVNHKPGRDVADAHPVAIAPESRLAFLRSPDQNREEFVNSSHHQAIRTPGDNLRVTAVSPVDGIIEAVELDSSNHFVVAVQWHPERTYRSNPFSRAIFDAFSKAVSTWGLRQIQESVVQR